MNKAIKFSKKDNSVRYGRCVYHIELNNVELDVEVKNPMKDNSVRYGRCVYHIELNNVELDVEVKNPMILEEWVGYYITSYEIVYYGKNNENF